MTKPLVIVESPTKVRTIKKYIGNEFNVIATVGHIRDLPPKEIGIDIDNDFKPKYITIPGKSKIISGLKKAAGNTRLIYLAADPDREGEAIAWHTATVLKKKNRKFVRILFHELTKNAIKAAIEKSLELDTAKYNAQQARRIIDRLVGYQVSPLLWRKVKQGLSAGRVQSVAVRIICDRERAIQAFDPEEYWSITAHLQGDNPPPFAAKLAKKNNKKLKIPDQKTSKAILAEIDQEKFIVDKITKKTTKRNPLPPFITSKLQQESIHKLRFSAKKTMIIAQQLYEGVDLGPGEPEGLITYMRTDSTRIAMEAALDALDYINQTFGEKYALDKPRFFKNKKKVQDAHEAIRPTSVYNTPEKLKAFLTEEQFKLYSLIWKRFVASQMQPALINRNSIFIKAGIYLFTASGSTIKFPGFMSLYQSAADEAESKKKSQVLPELKEQIVLKLDEIIPKQHFTMPPPRFSEASLVKELEENGIGRPSTYANILSTIRGKGYVDLQKGYFRPNELGFIVNDLLINSFPELFGVDFTARLENELDMIESSEMNYLDVLKQFYDPFKQKLDGAAKEMISIKGQGIPTDLDCPKCKKHKLHIKIGKNGHFLTCSGYPDCTYSRDYIRDEKGKIEVVEPSYENVTDTVCNKCGKPMVVKRGRYGEFLACTGYPDCKFTQSLHSTGSGKDIGVDCPEDGCDGKIVEKSSKRGKIFYGCDQFPKCKFATWDKPVNKECPLCKAKFLVQKSTKKKGDFLACYNKDCDYKEF